MADTSSTRRIAPWHWALPPLWLALTFPLWLGWFEPALFYALNHAFGVMPDRFWSLCSLFGTGWAIYAVTAPALWRSPRLVLAWLCTAPLAGAFTRMGKAMADNPRPLEVLGPQGLHVIGEPLYIASMPSGHTITAFAGAAALYFTLDPARRRPWLLLFAAAAAVGCSRVAVGAHWPADTVVGAAAGLLSGLSGAWLAQRIPQRLVHARSALVRAVALLGFYCVYVLWTEEMGFAINMPFQYVLGAFLLACLAVFAWQSFGPVTPAAGDGGTAAP
jgi:membrane-associated phospholipid phosphatase